MKTKQLLGSVAIAVGLMLPALVSAQDRSALLLKVPGDEALSGTTGRAQPGVSASSPLAFGPNLGDVFVGAGYQARTRYTNAQDGTVSVGAGVGNSQSAVGLGLVLTSLSTVHSGFGNRMVAAVQLHRDLPANAAVGVGVEGIKVDGINDSKESYYLAVSQSEQLGDASGWFSSLMLNAGVGNGRFQSEKDFNAKKNGWNAFASAGLRISPAFSAIADWTGQDLALGVSIAPLPSVGLVLTPALADVTGSAGDGARFTLGAGLSWHF
jgi:hypothetical protein